MVTSALPKPPKETLDGPIAAAPPSPASDGNPVTKERYTSVRDEELEQLGGIGEGRYRDAAAILDQLVLSDTFEQFLTIPAYAILD